MWISLLMTYNSDFSPCGKHVLKRALFVHIYPQLAAFIFEELILYPLLPALRTHRDRAILRFFHGHV